MRQEFVELLVCPQCQASLVLKPFRVVSQSDDEIQEGLLVCSECSRAYPVSKGIPRMLPNAFRQSRTFRREFSQELAELDFLEPPTEETAKFEALHRLTARAFGYEWNTYKVTSRAEDLITFFWLTGADPNLYDKFSFDDVFSFYPNDADIQKINGSQLAGKTVLDVGCGMGKYLDVVSDYAETVVGLDLSEALLRAQLTVRDRKNVHLVQGNILQPPLKPAFADFVYSVGVLHHTPNTHAAFLSAASLVAPGGRLAVWLYPREKEPNPYSDRIHYIQDDLIRPITCRLPPRMLRVFAAVLGRLTFVRDRAVIRHQTTGSRIAGRIAHYAGTVAVGRHRDPTIAAFLNFDWYSPQYRSYHSELEVERWYREAGFDNVRMLPQRVSSIATRVS